MTTYKILTDEEQYAIQIGEDISEPVDYGDPCVFLTEDGELFAAWIADPDMPDVKLYQLTTKPGNQISFSEVSCEIEDAEITVDEEEDDEDQETEDEEGAPAEQENA